MASLNKKEKKPTGFTHEGAVASTTTNEEDLRRSVMCCFLWEGEFYEDGASIADRIADLSTKVPVKTALDIALEARTKHGIRHAPLWIVTSLLKNSSTDRSLIGDYIPKIIQRPDEMGELISMYWKGGDKAPLPNQLKRGLAKSFHNFSEYQFAKYSGERRDISIRNVMFLTHPKPTTEQEATLFRNIANRSLPTPDTWETQLSAGGDKGKVFLRLMEEGKLGALAFLRNLRNMQQAGVPLEAVENYAQKVNTDRVLPFRFLSAANAVPKWSHVIEEMMLRSLSEVEPWKGRTIILVDNSGSMYRTRVSANSDLERIDAACALAILVRAVCEHATVIPFSYDPTVLDSHYKGLALKDAIKRTQSAGTDIKEAVLRANEIGYDRIILITDEQSKTRFPDPLVPSHKAFCINVASCEKGLGYRRWTHIDGFSEAVVQFMWEHERSKESFTS